MKPAPFAYHDPVSLPEALDLLGRLENTRPLAGGQSLVSMMNFRYVTPDHVVDLNGIGALAGISVQDGMVELGAMTRQRAIEFSSELAQICPILREGILNVGHRQTRNRGTVGGSLCHLDPSAELPSLMLLHDAVLACEQSGGKRDLTMPDFALGYMTSALEPGELLTRISFSAWPAGPGYGFAEYARRHGDFAIASAGALVTLDAAGNVTRLAVVLSGLGPVPVRLVDLEHAAVGAAASEDLVRAICDAAGSLEAMEDAHVSATYRSHLASVLAGRAVRRAFARARERKLADA